MEYQIRRKNWSWKGHSLRKPTQHVKRQALTRNPQAKGKGRETPGAEKWKQGWTLLKTWLLNRLGWKGIVKDLWSVREWKGLTNKYETITHYSTKCNSKFLAQSRTARIVLLSAARVGHVSAFLSLPLINNSVGGRVIYDRLQPVIVRDDKIDIKVIGYPALLDGDGLWRRRSLVHGIPSIETAWEIK